MIKDFDQLKKQLSELSSVINSFKSEAVQLKIVELIFRGSTAEDPSTTDQPPADGQPAKGKPAKSRTPKKSRPQSAISPKKSGKVGPATILEELIGDGFFDNARTIGNIIEHCSAKKARKLKANELSGPLGRFVRNGRLSREKNGDGQYEYTKA